MKLYIKLNSLDKNFYFYYLPELYILFNSLPVTLTLPFYTIGMKVNGRECGYCSSTEQLKKKSTTYPLCSD